MNDGGPVTAWPWRVPRIGAVSGLAVGQWRYQERPLRLRVTRVRADISRWYGGDRVWVYGTELDDAGRPVDTMGALVRCDAIPDDAAETSVGMS
jgi:hypothetical protein